MLQWKGMHQRIYGQDSVNCIWLVKKKNSRGHKVGWSGKRNESECSWKVNLIKTHCTNFSRNNKMKERKKETLMSVELFHSSSFQWAFDLKGMPTIFSCLWFTSARFQAGQLKGSGQCSVPMTHNLRRFPETNFVVVVRAIIQYGLLCSSTEKLWFFFSFFLFDMFSSCLIRCWRSSIGLHIWWVLALTLSYTPSHVRHILFNFKQNPPHLNVAVTSNLRNHKRYRLSWAMAPAMFSCWLRWPEMLLSGRHTHSSSREE